MTSASEGGQTEVKIKKENTPEGQQENRVHQNKELNKGELKGVFVCVR